MSQRPILLIILATILFGVSASFFIQIMYLFDHSIFEFDLITSKLTYLNWSIVILSAVNGALTLRASKLIYWTTPFLISAVFINNANVASVGIDFGSVSTTVASFGFLFSQAILLNPKVSKILLDPALQWWKIPKRKTIVVPVRIKVMGQDFSAKTFDISKTGVFVTGLRSVDDQSNVDFIESFKPADRIDLSFHISNRDRIKCTGTVRRMTEQSGRYPNGMGIQFETLAFSQRRKLRRIINLPH